MTFTKSKILNILYGVLLAAFIAFLLTPFYYPRLSDMLYFKSKYNNVHYLDEQKRCVVFELKPSEEQKQRKDYKPILKFYDMEKGKFVHLGTDIIQDVKGIRPGYFALYGFSGLQDYSIVMPYASEDYTARMEDEIQVISCVPDEWYRHLETMDNPKLPNNIKAAEDLLIKQYEETGQCGNELIDYIRVNQETLDYDFDGIKKKTNISILTSPDKEMRFYTWDTGRGGTSPDFVAYVQYNYGKSVFVGQFTPLTPSKYVTKNKVKRDGYVPYDGAWIGCLYQIDQPDGYPIYITSAYNKASSSEGGQDAYAFKVVKGLLEKMSDRYDKYQLKDGNVPAYRHGSGDDFGKFIIRKNGKVIQESKV